MDISNATAQETLPGGYTFEQFFFFCVLLGLCLEGNLHALIRIIPGLFVNRKKTSSLSHARRFQKDLVPILTLICNMSMMVNNFASLVLMLPLLESACWPVSFTDILSSHLMFMSFDALILFRSYVITNRNIYVYWATICMLFTRLCCTLWDLCTTYGQPDGLDCLYIQNPMSLQVYSSLDLISDIFSTLAAIGVAVWRVGFGSSQTKYLVFMSVARSASIMVADILVLYADFVWPTSWAQDFVWNIQIYILCRCLNLELVIPPIRPKQLGKSKPKMAENIIQDKIPTFPESSNRKDLRMVSMRSLMSVKENDDRRAAKIQ